MKVLLISRSDDIFTIDLVRQLSQNDKINFSLFDTKIATLFDFQYKTRKNLVKSNFLWSLKIFRPIISTLILKQILAKKNKDFDYIHFLYKKNRYFLIINTLKNIKTKKICSVYGSDFYKSKTKLLDKYFYKTMDYITFTNEETRNNFNNSYKNIFKNKISICNFGLNSIDLISKIKKKESIAKSKKMLNVDTNSIVITCGGNGTPNEQHEVLIKTLSSIKYIKSKNITLVFPMTYGANNNRQKKIKNYIKSYLKSYKCKVFDIYLDPENIARLRIITDIFINIRKTDQFSAAMTETIYAGGVVITGSWLPYKILNKKQSFFIFKLIR